MKYLGATSRECSLVCRRINENYVNNYDICFRKSSEAFVDKVKTWYDDQVRILAGLSLGAVTCNTCYG